MDRLVQVSSIVACKKKIFKFDAESTDTWALIPNKLSIASFKLAFFVVLLDETRYDIIGNPARTRMYEGLSSPADFSRLFWYRRRFLL